MRKIFFALVLIIILTGCSGGGNAPVTPSNDKPANPVGSLDSVPIIAGAMNEDGSFNALGLMGAYEMTIDPATATAELVSKRLPTLGQSWTISGIGFFTIAPCSDCLQISSIALSVENYLQLTFHIKHPFPKGDLLLPPSAKNRLDLDVFDVALVIQPMGSTPVNYALTGAKIYSGILANNAGYTTEIANVTGDKAALPYALVIDDSLGSSSTWNKFAMGADSFFDGFFNLPAVGGHFFCRLKAHGADFFDAESAGCPCYVNGYVAAANHEHAVTDFNFLAGINISQEVQSQFHLRQVHAGDGQTAALLRPDGQIDCLIALRFQVVQRGFAVDRRVKL